MKEETAETDCMDRLVLQSFDILYIYTHTHVIYMEVVTPKKIFKSRIPVDSHSCDPTMPISGGLERPGPSLVRRGEGGPPCDMEVKMVPVYGIRLSNYSW
jgi:hypothetical protein